MRNHACRFWGKNFNWDRGFPAFVGYVQWCMGITKMLYFHQKYK